MSGLSRLMDTLYIMWNVLWNAIITYSPDPAPLRICPFVRAASHSTGMSYLAVYCGAAQGDLVWPHHGFTQIGTHGRSCSWNLR